MIESQRTTVALLAQRQADKMAMVCQIMPQPRHGGQLRVQKTLPIRINDQLLSRSRLVDMGDFDG